MTRTYPQKPLVGVGVVVWRGDRVLLIRRSKPPRAGQWSLPGGAQRLGETLAETAKREVFEETGVEIELGELIDTIDLIETDQIGAIRYHYTLIDFAAEAKSTDLQAGDDASAAAWFDRGTLGRLDLWSETVRIIDLAYERTKKAQG